MSEIKYMYKCSKCGKTEEVTDDDKMPYCCEKVMEKLPLDQCTTADHPEMARNYDSGEPCDDNRGK